MTRVLIVDDSAIIRTVARRMLDAGLDPTQSPVCTDEPQSRSTYCLLWLAGGELPCQVSGSNNMSPEPSYCSPK